MWWPSLITTSSTSKNVVNVVLVNWKQPESIKNVTKITEYPVWKISIYYTRHPPMLMHWTQRIGVPSSRRTASNSAHKNMPNLDQVHLRKIFCWPFFSCLENLVDLSLATFLIFSTFPFFGHFLTVLGYFHQSHALKFPCTPRIPWPWCAKFGTNHIAPDTPWNSWRNHTTTPDIFGITCIFSSLAEYVLIKQKNLWMNRGCSER